MAIISYSWQTVVAPLLANDLVTAGDQRNPAIAATTSGRYFATWDEPASDPVNMLIRQILGDLGYVEGKSIVIEWRNVEPALASELSQPKLDAIMAIGASAIQAARQATSTTRAPPYKRSLRPAGNRARYSSGRFVTCTTTRTSTGAFFPSSFNPSCS